MRFTVVHDDERFLMQREYQRPFTILLVEDHNLFATTLATAIKDFVVDAVVSHADNGMEALTILSRRDTDIIFLDIQMPVMNGIDTLKELRKFDQNVPVIILTQFDDSVLIEDLYALGATGYLPKNCNWSEFENVLSFYKQRMVNSVREENVIINTKKGTTVNLSRREKELLRLLQEGKSNAEMANILGLSVHTISSYRKSMNKKTQCKSAAELISLAYRTGMFFPNI